MDAAEVPFDGVGRAGGAQPAFPSRDQPPGRAPYLAAYPLHRDEALYGYWARLIASGQDPLLLTPWIDKPPLVLYLIAGSFRLFGAGGAAANDLALRLPGMVASVLAVPALYGLARAVYGRRVGLLAAALFALSPFAILFAPTAFTDPWLTLWLLLAAWATLARRPFLAGLLAALAIASKQQGVFVVPLVLLIASGDTLDDRPVKRPVRAQASRRSAVLARLKPFGAGLLGSALAFGPLTYWDSLRWHNRPSFWDRSLSTYNPLTLAAPAEWPLRLGRWAEQAGYWFGHPAITAGVLALAAAAVYLGLRSCHGPWTAIQAEDAGSALSGGRTQRGRSRRGGHSPSSGHDPWAIIQDKDAGSTLSGGRTQCGRSRRGGHSQSSGTESSGPVRVPEQQDAAAAQLSPREARLTILFAAYALGYFALHVLVTFQPWDRYLLPLLPLVCLLAGRGLAALLAAERGPLPALALAIALTGAAALGVTGRLPIGSDHGAYAGLPQVVAQLRRQPADAVIYQHALGWHFDYYLFDAPQESRVLPTFEQEWAEAARLPLAGRGLALAEAGRIRRRDGSASFVLYRVTSAHAAGP
ncbi:MAG: hypothetical protein BWY52_01751 [Chloroflexi bacterium ADurb.Bin325]|nr:MAG: hypothetical protein BWY52_01751 [Chloroflexi bacterium ADurb.Bin325]